MILSLTVKTTLSVIGLHWVVVVYSYCGSRLILNLRVAAQGDASSSFSTGRLRVPKFARFSEFDSTMDSEIQHIELRMA
ncbi:hypothetical protein NLI96_g4313 [Meripilus lineatus]|uniref:Uncharacterized protein n=1 Tax=Meripilus lineatus TaxID=2056292 RepID=A0AAD5V761_9APHY|nr:hypothetical protein NLI96_g4313 [Physisporinus lineatus]